MSLRWYVRHGLHQQKSTRLCSGTEIPQEENEGGIRAMNFLHQGLGFGKCRAPRGPKWSPRRHGVGSKGLDFGGGRFFLHLLIRHYHACQIQGQAKQQSHRILNMMGIAWRHNHAPWCPLTSDINGVLLVHVHHHSWSDKMSQGLQRGQQNIWSNIGDSKNDKPPTRLGWQT